MYIILCFAQLQTHSEILQNLSALFCNIKN